MGQFLDGTSYSGASSHPIEFLRKSVCDNLYRLLNTNKGMHYINDSLGISDSILPIGNIQKFRESLRQEIIENINLFEPRLNHARCMYIEAENNKDTQNLTYRVSGSLQGFRCHFQIDFLANGHCLVNAI